MQNRKIIHIDMDAFYASIEQRDNPRLIGKPIAVGGGGKKGVVCAASYEARVYGVRAAMPGFMVRQKCPNIIFVKPNFKKYKEVSKQIRSFFYEYTDLVEPLSLDEAYLDVTENHKRLKSAIKIANDLRRRIVKELSLTASAGVSYNKFLAKVASDVNKPNGIKVILPKEAGLFLDTLPIERFYGVGKVTANKFKKKGIHNGLDLKGVSKEDLLTDFGKYGGYYYDVVRGIDNRLVTPHRERKSIGVERTFLENSNDKLFLKNKIDEICLDLWQRMEKSMLYGKTLTVKFKFSNFSISSKTITFNFYINSSDSLHSIAWNMLVGAYCFNIKLRLIGVSISNFESHNSVGEEQQIPIKFTSPK